MMDMTAGADQWSGADAGRAARRLRVLFLASYFPKPANPYMGTWALSQAQALARQRIDLEVLSFTSWVPRPLGRTPGARAYAECPSAHSWDGLAVGYPRWLYYPVGPMKKWAYKDPRRQMKLAWLTSRRELLARVRAHRPDVIYCHHTLPNGYLARQLHGRLGIPYVITDHDFEEIGDCERRPRRRQVFEHVVNSAWLWVAVASRMEATMKRLFPSARTRTIPNGCEPLPDRFWRTPRPPELEGRTIVFSAGAFAPRKAFPLLVRAFARAAERHPGAVLRIAGDGQQRAETEAAIKESGLEGRVELLGFQPRERVLQEMVWADMFALIGWDEPLATVYFEAMAAGKPMVWANDGGINDVIRDGQHGHSVEPRSLESAAAALERLLSAPEARAEMGAAARRKLEADLTWDVNAARMYEVFRSAAEANPCSRAPAAMPR
jgi:glycosyltransferase involved in cell wall biosynthesis